MNRFAIVKMIHVMPHAQTKPTTTWNDLRDELAARRRRTGRVTLPADAVPAGAVGAVGEQPDREHAPGAAHAVHRDRAARVVDVADVVEEHDAVARRASRRRRR